MRPKTILYVGAAFVAALPEHGAIAQVVPGDARCPVAAGIVTCSGDLAEGVSVPAGAYDGLTVENVSGDIRVVNRSAITYRAGRPDASLRIQDTDSVIRMDLGGSDGAAQPRAAVDLLVRDAGLVSLDTAIGIAVRQVINSDGPKDFLPVGLLVQGTGGRFTLNNGGDISLTVSAPHIPDFEGGFGAAIYLRVPGSLVALRNSGRLEGNVDNGIVVAGAREVDLVNDGVIDVSASPFASGITLGGGPFIPAPELELPEGPMRIERYSIVNNGSVIAGTKGIIAVSGARGTMVNNGLIRLLGDRATDISGAMASGAEGEQTLTNNGTIELLGQNLAGLFVSPANGGQADFARGDLLLDNSASGVIQGTGTRLAGAYLSAPGTIRNAGRMSLTGETMFGLIGEGYSGIIRFENSGEIRLDGPGSVGIFGLAIVLGPVDDEAPNAGFSDLRVSNSGLVEALGAGSFGMSFEHPATGEPGADRSEMVTIQLTADSVVRGGSGEGAAIRFLNGDSHSIVNAGLITAASGRSIIGGTGAERVDNSGRIEGLVSLGDGDDEVIAHPGARFTALVDGGGGTDTFRLAGGASTSERFDLAQSPLAGFERYFKEGEGSWALEGDGSAAGIWTVAGGTLLVNGNLGGVAFTVNEGGTLGGSGMLGTTDIASGGTLSPGASIDTLRITGNLTFASGSNLLVEVDPTSADRVEVSGTASLAGTLTAQSLGGSFAAGSRYILLTAGAGIAGTFNSLVTQGSYGGLAPTLSYEANNVILTLGQAGPTDTFTTSVTDNIVLNSPTITVERISLFETRIIGRLTAGTPLFDQIYDDAFDSATVQNGIAAARLAITAAGGPGVVLISDPVLVSRSVTSTTASTSVFSLAGSAETVTTITTFGPATVTIGDQRSCGAAIATLPADVRPVCGTPGGDSFTVAADTVNVNTNTDITYFIDEARTDTITETTSETWELTGTVATIGTVHAAVQSGLYDLGSRFLARMGSEGAPGLFGVAAGPSYDGTSRLASGVGGNSGWAETYAFRTRGDPRGGIAAERRDAWGLAGGFTLAPAPNVSFGFGIDHGQLDLAVPGSGEEADVELTQLGLAARAGSGPLSLALAGVYGFGSVDSSRSLLGFAAGSYDVQLWGAVAEARYRLEAGAWRIMPVAALDHLRIESDAFAESGQFGLAASRTRRNRTRASAGVEVGRSFAIQGDARLDLTAWARYAALVGGEARTLPVAFTAAPGSPLVMRGLSERNSALIGGQVRLGLGPRASLFLAYDGHFAGDYHAHGGAVGLRLGW